MSQTKRVHWSTALAFASLLLPLQAAGQVQLNLIQKENRQMGTTSWQLTNPAAHREIEGYASLTSVPNGGNIELFVNTADATYTLTVYRMGWYQGKGARRMLGPQVLPGVKQETPKPDPVTGVFECHWSNPFTIHVPASPAWLSGIYLVKLHGNISGKESYIIFTVRDSRLAALVFQQSVLTYHAYNPWPGNPVDGYIGASLYGFQVDPSLAGLPGYPTFPGLQALAVSLNRPYQVDFDFTAETDPKFYGVGAGDFLHNIGPAAMEFDMVRWLEHEGYNVTYITDVDTHEDVNRLLRAKGFLSVGHDEYWTDEMQSHVVQARDQGVGLGFFGSNYLYWQVKLLPDSNGVPNRTLALGPKADHCIDPTEGLTQTQCSADSDCSTGQQCGFKVAYNSLNIDANGVSETEQAIVGGMDQPGIVLDVHYGSDIYISNDTPLDHWVFANTDLKFGDVIPGLIGVEVNSTIKAEDWLDKTVPFPNFPLPNGLVTLLHTQAPNFAATGGIGGFPFPASFNEDFNGWFDSVQSTYANANGVIQDPEHTVCQVNTSQLCASNLDCPKDQQGNHTACVYPCHQDPIPPLNIKPTDGFCSNPAPVYPGLREDWAMTIYQAPSGAWVFNAATNDWTWGLDDYFTGINNGDGVNNGPQLPMRAQCGYPWFHPGLVSCKSPAIEQITRNVLNRFVAGN